MQWGCGVGVWRRGRSDTYIWNSKKQIHRYISRPEKKGGRIIPNARLHYVIYKPGRSVSYKIACYRVTYWIANSADPDQLASLKPTDLDVHCLKKQGISGFSRINSLKFCTRTYAAGCQQPFCCCQQTINSHCPPWWQLTQIRKYANWSVIASRLMGSQTSKLSFEGYVDAQADLSLQLTHKQSCRGSYRMLFFPQPRNQFITFLPDSSTHI